MLGRNIDMKSDGEQVDEQWNVHQLSSAGFLGPTMKGGSGG
jgi:hypothetical protein